MNDLRKLAEEATPGPWRVEPYLVGDTVDGGAVYTATPNWHNGGVITYGGGEGLSPACSVEDAAYIAAASPDVILGLLDRIAELEKALRPLLEARHNQAHNGDIVEGGPFGEGCPFCAPVWDLLENIAREAARSSSKVETGVEK